MSSPSAPAQWLTRSTDATVKNEGAPLPTMNDMRKEVARMSQEISTPNSTMYSNEVYGGAVATLDKRFTEMYGNILKITDTNELKSRD